MSHFALKRFLSYALVFLFATAGLQAQVSAAMVETPQLAGEVSQQQQREALAELFAREDVRQQLSAMGVDPVDASERVASLSASEVQMLSEKLGQLPAGGSALGVIALVLLILILLDIAGVTDIFSGV